jgi:hypothetical protein
LAGYPQSPLPQVNPQFDNGCLPDRPQSTHQGGLFVCMGDASVRFVGLSGLTLASWAAANDPRDAATIGNDFWQ